MRRNMQQERRRQAILEAASKARSDLSVAESRLSELSGQFNKQTEELRTTSATRNELLSLNARLQSLVEQGEKTRADLVTEKNILADELRQERVRRAVLETDSRVAISRVESLVSETTSIRGQVAELEVERKTLTDRVATLTGESQGLAKERDGLRQQLADQKSWIEEQTTQFERKVLSTAATMMEERGRAFTESNRKEVETVIGPFKEQLAEFRTRVDHIYSTDTKDRGELKQQIEHLTSFNQGVSQQTERLINALTVTSKSTGDWGETILRRILEESGLRDGKEYRLQYSISDSEGDRVQPDAVIFLPENRQLVIDSKVSNKAWTEYCHETDEELKRMRLREHLASLR